MNTDLVVMHRGNVEVKKQFKTN